MTLRKVLAVVVLGAGLSASVSAQMLEPQGEVTYPVSARVEWPPTKPADGARGSVKVHIRNTVTEAGRNGVAMTLMAVVLRGVCWSNEPGSQDGTKWFKPIHGSTRTNRDGTVEHNTVAQRMTELVFESGLLLPGEELTVELPAPADGVATTLSVSYAVVPGNFESQILLAEPISPKGTGELTVKYLPYSAATARARERVRGVALVKATMDPRAAALPVREQKLVFAVPAGR